ncbi:MAG: transcription termination/antitermination protein NusA [Clostridia bacterium]|nr:transcription termination/antitermination protein NusA [Clostridia bacterium]
MTQKNEIYDAIEMLAKAKDIPVDTILEAVEEGIKAAYKKYIKRSSTPMNLSVVIAKGHDIQVYARKSVTDSVTDELQQISLEDANRMRSGYELGDIVEVDVTPKDFGRVAAQTAKQVITQRLRDAEHGKIYDEYIDKENEILTGIVERVDARNVYVELGRTQGVMESAEFMPGEEYHPGDHIKVYVLQVHRNGKDAYRLPQVSVSRIHPGLVKRLFEMEVPEIQQGQVQIKSIAREAGSRTKMAVCSTDLSIDPVGACVGPRGMRVDKVVSELKNEKIDIIKWSEDEAEFVANALNPAHVINVYVSDEEHICRVVVPDSQLSLAIGKEGQNARLAAKLTGWKIDIKSQSQFNELMGLSAQGIQQGNGSVIADEAEDYDSGIDDDTIE